MASTSPSWLVTDECHVESGVVLWLRSPVDDFCPADCCGTASFEMGMMRVWFQCTVVLSALASHGIDQRRIWLSASSADSELTSPAAASDQRRCPFSVKSGKLRGLREPR
uniref:(northern house mosquito) hypothetical protein n=1 Tax=Culex pipiens TaxID=7175 RepID=A0A8D8A1J7_CULPI